jgi:hypothetical protein
MSIVWEVEVLGSGKFELLSVYAITTGTIEKMLEVL